MVNYKEKYLKYKLKYLNLRNKFSGGSNQMVQKAIYHGHILKDMTPEGVKTFCLADKKIQELCSKPKQIKVLILNKYDHAVIGETEPISISINILDNIRTTIHKHIEYTISKISQQANQETIEIVVTDRQDMFYKYIPLHTEQEITYKVEVYPVPLVDQNIKTAVQNYNIKEYKENYGHITDWNTSAVTNMTQLFDDMIDFNEPLYWDTSAVTSMVSCFSHARTFNGDISRWDTSKVTTMENMFYGASAFDRDISRWNTSAVTTMEGMFYEAHSFNRDINTRQVEEPNGKVYTAWDTSAVTSMDSMFSNDSDAAAHIVFNRDISNWDTSSVENMNYMFAGASDFNIDISRWNTSAVITMTGMFFGARSFNRDITRIKVQELNGKVYTAWDTSAVTDMSNMFRDASDFNGNISNWNTSSLEFWDDMFLGATVFKQDISGWNTSSLIGDTNSYGA
tara:strand:- start:1481 stop:2839 length:1359 start_codon:yes stop_codon:yes gene_type:complete